MSDVVSKVKSWLEKQGYPLEMEVARAFALRGFSSALSTYYEDPVTELAREIDVRAIREVTAGRSTTRVVVTVECKNASAFPWVLFTPHNDLPSPDPSTLFLTSGGARARLMEILRESQPGLLRLSAETFPVGYSISEARIGSAGEKGRKDLPYEACMQAVSAARSFAPRGLHFHAGGGEISTLAIPLVVIRGCLVAASLPRETSDTQLEVVKHDRGAVLWSHPGASVEDKLVFLVTFAALASFLDDLCVTADAFLAPKAS